MRMDLEVSPALTIPAAELGWRFSRSSGPGGQHVNTSDSRVQLSWNVAESVVLSDDQRLLLLARLERRLVDGVLTVTAAEQRSQLRNREIALDKLAELVAEGLAPAAPNRRPTRRTRGSNRRRLAAKGARSETKRQRRRPDAE
ncbi:alternative ribosome rescue aminoacyl-tRNA hydrolase ArfB [Frondihabitans cladoniiphilus]|uniref:Alternative ribosome rescue aminoacyl-tRNA hydrolase ArfB n=2 Tax=Frondihabitans cladoniiphilus TaxID=715785 RepID=A0ABP8VIV2_9MICO